MVRHGGMTVLTEKDSIKSNNEQIVNAQFFQYHFILEENEKT